MTKVKAIHLQHYESTGESAMPVFTYEHWLNVEDVVDIQTDDFGVCGNAVMKDGSKIPVSRLIHQGDDRRWISCIDDVTGKRWA